MIYKINDKDIHHNSIYPFFKSFIRIIIQNNNNKIVLNIIDGILCNSLNKITNILNYNNFLSINNPEFQSLQNFMKEILKQLNKKNNKTFEKLNIIKNINDSIYKKKTFFDILFDKYINKEKEQDLSKMNNIFKYLYTIFMVFIQFF